MVDLERPNPKFPGGGGAKKFFYKPSKKRLKRTEETTEAEQGQSRILTLLAKSRKRWKKG